ALELLLPHLLDAKGLPGRLSTSGADRGGLWDRVSGYDEGEPRTGYLWLEFALDDERTFTAGVRLRAKPSGGGDKHWFTTPRRVAIDFSLLDEHRRPLSVEQLTEAVGAEGRVWGSDSSGYRQAIRTTLFPGWSDDRLDALIRTLLVVRKQNVIDGLSPTRLSDLLSEALPPLDDLELGRVADGFADLDRRRDHIAQLEKDVAESRRLSDANRGYARSVTARVVAEVVSATTAFDNVAREVRRLSDELARWKGRVQQLEEQEAALDTEDQGLAGRLDGLKSSEAYKHGAELENLQQAAQGAKRRAKEAEREATEARGRAETRRRKAKEAEDGHVLAEQQMRRSREELEDVAKSLGADMLEEVAADALASATNTWIDGRQNAIHEVRRQLHALDLAIERRKSAQKHQTDCEGRLSTAEDSLRVATRAADEARKTWRHAVSTWRTDARELHPYLGILDDPETALGMVTEARNSAQEPLLDRRSQIEQRSTALDAELQDLRDERDAWIAGKDPEPDIPAGRRDRAGLVGAPLWRLIQFREQVADDVRGKIESALADSRLLDAWVSPEGEIAIAENDSDLQLILAPAATEHERTLASLLEPDPASDAMGRETVETLLGSLTIVERDAHEASVPARGVLIGMDGSWQTPRLAGRAAVGPARYIGASSREATRRARIADLDRGIAVREEEQHALQSERDTLTARIQRCKEEMGSFPPIKEIQDAEQDADRKRVRMESARDQLVQANTALSSVNEEVKGHQRALHTAAMGHSLPTDAAGLAKVEAWLGSLRNAVFAFQGCHERAQSAKRDASLAEDVAVEAKREAEQRSVTARTRRGEFEEAASRFAAVEKALGADYKEVMGEIRAVTERRSEIQAEQKNLRVQHSEAVEKRGSAGNAVNQAEVKRTTAEAQRAQAGEAFVALCRDGLPTDAAIADPPVAQTLTTTTAILDAARRIRSSGVLPSIPSDADLARMSNNVMARLGDASRQLAGRADLNFEAGDRFWSVLRVRREGIVASSSALLEGLREDLEAARSELSQKQQELFEQILSGSVREHLKGRLWAAQALVDRINGLLEEVRTESGGVRVSLKWEINPDLSEAGELRQAKELLLHDSPVAQGRSQLDAFLRGRIERVRAAEDDTGEWRERLARMLDYRSWHRSRVLVHHNRFGDKPRALDSKKVSLSAGEKTIVMVLPLIAAVTAHYEPAPGDPPCVSPRLLLMDELFPKLDFPNKRKLMGLLPKLHLDAVFTSDKDRCEYDTLDGIAIHVCQKLGDDKTSTTRLVWNGSETRVATGNSGDGHGDDGGGRRAPLTRVKG
ncbi:MAG: TIGR02680 family protein, partial [Proteobacteria bacterium]|nr:TIGR02680 family protein [Pseudomonadota bacterium]